MRPHQVLTPTVLLGIATSPASAASFRGLDMPPNYNSRFTALSPDGSVVMGEMWAPGMPSETFRWTAQTGLTRQADLPGWGGYAWPYAMSYDGGVVVGYDTHPAIAPGHAFKWTSGTGRVYLDDPAQVDQSEPWGLSWDGATVVGYRVLAGQTQPEAIIWQNGHTHPLGQVQGGQGTFATGISSTGTVVGMTSPSSGPAKPFRWTSQAGIEFISLPDSVHFHSGLCISADGKTIVGDWGQEGRGNEAFAWTEGAGAFGLGDLPGGGFGSTVGGVSADGQIIVGSSVTGSFSPDGHLVMDTTTAFVWDQAHGMRSLPEVLMEQYGLDLQGWELWEATGISADGRTIVGNGASPDGYWRTWIAQVPEPSPALILLLAVGLTPRSRHTQHQPPRTGTC